MTLVNAQQERGDALQVSVSMVTFHSDIDLLQRTLDGLAQALRYAQEQGSNIGLQLLLVDNSTTPEYRDALGAVLGTAERYGFDALQLWHPGGNIGYGAAHNQAIERVTSDYHIILNPDVELAEDALFSGLQYMKTQSDVVIVSPRATNATGQVQYLCKRYPSILVLMLRAFAPEVIKRHFEPYLNDYEIRDVCGTAAAADVPLVSGCCMYARTDALRQVRGFSDRYFMYFEDFDLSLRMQYLGRLVYLPSMHIVHHGGYSARKGLRHISMFAQSGWKFFRRHGWCWI